ncbi:hypothetical protein AX774_g5146 [Zancudomyces culisetae]|uniref:Uncharacterized protein n=1 Tax=Zancudomyces culisetae TaxID=1213189 RepID=A0A1R1PKA2_ZANCU|nr:hypothetical protein AX774_g5146 [Zancudomyces culisetae]|eukprot:OMH81400.1 hypothetical protein AX774_g5146 [Zancudomyces culisetae]
MKPPTSPPKDTTTRNMFTFVPTKIAKADYYYFLCIVEIKQSGHTEMKNIIKLNPAGRLPFFYLHGIW